MTLLHYAIKQRNEKAVSLLLENNADPNEVDQDGRNALHWVANCYRTDGGCELAQLLLKHKANPNQKGGWYENTPLHWALDNKKLTELLLQNGADPNIITAHEENVLFMMEHPNEETIKLLLQYGANFSQRNCYGESFLEVLPKKLKEKFYLPIKNDDFL